MMTRELSKIWAKHLQKNRYMPGTMISTWTHAIAYFTYMWRRKIRRLPVCTDQNSEWGDNEKKYNRKTKVKKKRGRVWWHFNSPTKWNKKVIRSITTTTTNTILKMWRVLYKSRKIGRMELIEKTLHNTMKQVKGEKRYKVQPNLDRRTALRNIIDRKLCADDRAISIYLSICTSKLKVQVLRTLSSVVTIKKKNKWVYHEG